MYRLPNYKIISQDILDYEIPQWAISYVSIDKANGDYSLIAKPNNYESMLAECKEGKKKIKGHLEKFTLNDYPAKKDIEKYAKDYVLYNFLIGMIEQLKNRQRKIAGDKNANDGSGIQHWIPKCYMRNFSTKKNGVEEVEVGFYENNVWKSKKVNLDSSEYFCETKGQSGKYYSDKFEIILGKMETDYASVIAGKRIPENMWDFLILAIFFSILDLRVDNSKGFPAKEIAIIALIPKVVSEYKLFIKDCSDFLEENGSLAFTAHPATHTYSDVNPEIYSVINSDGSLDIDSPLGSMLYLFAPFSSKEIILFLPRSVMSLDEASQYFSEKSGLVSDTLLPLYVTTYISYDPFEFDIIFYSPNTKAQNVKFPISFTV